MVTGKHRLAEEHINAQFTVAGRGVVHTDARTHAPQMLHHPGEIARIRRARDGADRRSDDPTPDDLDGVDLDGADLVDADVRVTATGRSADTSPFERIFVAYADCGTGGLLRRVCDEEGVEMLDGAHCYQFFATAPRFDEIQDAEIGSFYLTDFLVRHFERMVWNGLGLDRHPELLPMYFGNYTRLVYLAQTDDPELLTAAESAAAKLGLDMVVERTGYGELEPAMVQLSGARR